MTLTKLKKLQHTEKRLEIMTLMKKCGMVADRLKVSPHWTLFWAKMHSSQWREPNKLLIPVKLCHEYTYTYDVCQVKRSFCKSRKQMFVTQIENYHLVLYKNPNIFINICHQHHSPFKYL